MLGAATTGTGKVAGFTVVGCSVFGAGVDAGVDAGFEPVSGAGRVAGTGAGAPAGGTDAGAETHAPSNTIPNKGLIFIVIMILKERPGKPGLSKIALGL